MKDNWDDDEEEGGQAAEPEGPSLGSEAKETQSPEQGEEGGVEEGQEEEEGSSEEESSESDSEEELTPYEKAERRIMVHLYSTAVANFRGQTLFPAQKSTKFALAAKMSILEFTRCSALHICTSPVHVFTLHTLCLSNVACMCLCLSIAYYTA